MSYGKYTRCVMIQIGERWSSLHSEVRRPFNKFNQLMKARNMEHIKFIHYHSSLWSNRSRREKQETATKHSFVANAQVYSRLQIPLLNVAYLTVDLFSMALYKLVLIPDDHVGFAVVLSKDLNGFTTATKTWRVSFTRHCIRFYLYFKIHTQVLK